jgi:hypothetical protein
MLKLLFTIAILAGLAFKQSTGKYIAVFYTQFMIYLIVSQF